MTAQQFLALWFYCHMQYIKLHKVQRITFASTKSLLLLKVKQSHLVCPVCRNKTIDMCFYLGWNCRKFPS